MCDTGRMQVDSEDSVALAALQAMTAATLCQLLLFAGAHDCIRILWNDHMSTLWKGDAEGHISGRMSHMMKMCANLYCCQREGPIATALA